MAVPPTKDDVTEHELKLIGAMRHLKIKPEKVETTEEMETFIRDYNKEAIERRQLPRISIFFGEDGKGEVTYQTWKYEIECLKQEKKYPEDQILLAIRRAAKGEAANILRRLGVKVSIDEILKKFNSTFGDIDSPELIMKKFYAVKTKAIRVTHQLRSSYRGIIFSSRSSEGIRCKTGIYFKVGLLPGIETTIEAVWKLKV